MGRLVLASDTPIDWGDRFRLAFPLERFVLFGFLARHGARNSTASNAMTTPTLSVLDPTAAIDVGSETLHVFIAGGPPKIFGTVTGQLHALRDCLKENDVRTVAMEATGIY